MDPFTLAILSASLAFPIYAVDQAGGAIANAILSLF